MRAKTSPGTGLPPLWSSLNKSSTKLKFEAFRWEVRSRFTCMRMENLLKLTFGHIFLTIFFFPRTWFFLFRQNSMTLWSKKGDTCRKTSLTTRTLLVIIRSNTFPDLWVSSLFICCKFGSGKILLRAALRGSRGGSRIFSRGGGADF